MNSSSFFLLIVVAGLFVGVLYGDFFFEEETNSPVSTIQETNLTPDFTPPDQTSAENTVRTFWWAVKNKQRGIARYCVNEFKVAEGRHPVTDVEGLMDKMLVTDTTLFKFSSTSHEVSLRAPNYSMDYDLQPTAGGPWVITSIHP